MSRTLVRGGRLVDPTQDLDGRYDLLIEDGHVARIDGTIESRDGDAIVEASGLVVAPDNVEELASAITRVLVDSALRRRLTDGVARLAANELGWPARAVQMLAIYRGAREDV